MTEQRALICEAIRKKLLLEFRYGGLPRVVEPYIHGISNRGTEVLRAVQVGGSSNSGGFGYGKLWTVVVDTATEVGERTATFTAGSTARVEGRSVIILTRP